MADTDKGPVLVSVGNTTLSLYVGILVESKVTGKHVRVVLNHCRLIEPVDGVRYNKLHELSKYGIHELYPGHLATVGVPADWRVMAPVKKMVLTRVDEISFLSEEAWAGVKDRETSSLELGRDIDDEVIEEEEPQDTQTEVSPSTGEPSPDIQPVKETQSTPE